jgi:hypothetical protein
MPLSQALRAHACCIYAALHVEHALTLTLLFARAPRQAILKALLRDKLPFAQPLNPVMSMRGPVPLFMLLHTFTWSQRR